MTAKSHMRGTIDHHTDLGSGATLGPSATAVAQWIRRLRPEGSELFGYHKVARSCFGHPKLGVCMYNNIDCTANVSNHIMINDIIYTSRNCDDGQMKQCSSGQMCCGDFSSSRVLKTPKRSQWDFEVLKECSGQPECYHNIYRSDPVQMSVGYRCVGDKNMLKVCENHHLIANQIHIMFNRQHSELQVESNCTCRAVSSPGQNFRFYEIDIRLQKNWQIMMDRSRPAYQCSRSTLYLGPDNEVRCDPDRLAFSKFVSKSKVLSELDMSLTSLGKDFLDNPMMVWLAVEGLNKSDVKVVCGDPNVFPDISWIPEPEELRSSGSNVMMYIIIGAAVFGCLIFFWCCGCVYSRCSDRRQEHTKDHISMREDITKLAYLNENEQTCVKETGLTIECPNLSVESINSQTATPFLIETNDDATSSELVGNENSSSMPLIENHTEIKDTSDGPNKTDGLYSKTHKKGMASVV
ncbi:hypothetical protein ScPMuIL_012280 [Solemya velum]